MIMHADDVRLFTRVTVSLIGAAGLLYLSTFALFAI